MPEGVDAGPAPFDPDTPVRRLASWARRHPRLWLGTAVLVVLAAAVYVALAVSGLRRIEQAWLEARALGQVYRSQLTSLAVPEALGYRITVGDSDLERARSLTAEYSEHMADLAEEAGDVVAVDPRVRAARVAVVRALRDVARDSRSAALQSLLTLGPYPYSTEVDPALVAARVRWRLRPGRTPTPAPLASVARRRETPPFLSEPTGARLLVATSGRLIEIDIDAGAVRDRGPAASVIVTDAGLVVYEQTGSYLVDRDEVRHLLDSGPLEPDADDRSVVWRTGGFDGGADEVTFVERLRLDGSVDLPLREIAGNVDLLGGRWAVTTATADDGVGFAAYDVATKQRHFRSAVGAPLALRNGMVLWRHRAPTGAGDILRLRDLEHGTEQVLPPAELGWRVASAALSPGARHAVVFWFRADDDPLGVGYVVSVYDLAVPAAPRPLAAGTRQPTSTWSPDGAWLFVLGRDGRLGRISAWHTGTWRGGTVAVEGNFEWLAAL